MDRTDEIVSELRIVVLELKKQFELHNEVLRDMHRELREIKVRMNQMAR